ncbi:hypothetical protein CAOG_03875 [Capsaspora owczarzaki ATCC 30864]|uniref:hypothetical protein n=1 Tax=Capsaspora owczarzaki (strain ATCC 30864) TaxID=595528 RepID=UPI0003523900|nr:hypothetical protein CAOG_03875 [Capsaspora owczarzaki ATCC 30864]|eukprot:XP_004363603.2 hypothetical protein CAOG_03875 [Capsaspora owczarzaki ATCC 30864]
MSARAKHSPSFKKLTQLPQTSLPPLPAQDEDWLAVSTIRSDAQQPAANLAVGAQSKSRPESPNADSASTAAKAPQPDAENALSSQTSPQECLGGAGSDNNTAAIGIAGSGAFAKLAVVDVTVAAGVKDALRVVIALPANDAACSTFVKLQSQREVLLESPTLVVPSPALPAPKTGISPLKLYGRFLGKSPSPPPPPPGPGQSQLSTSTAATTTAALRDDTFVLLEATIPCSVLATVDTNLGAITHLTDANLPLPTPPSLLGKLTGWASYASYCNDLKVYFKAYWEKSKFHRQELRDVLLKCATVHNLYLDDDSVTDVVEPFGEFNFRALQKKVDDARATLNLAKDNRNKALAKDRHERSLAKAELRRKRIAAGSADQAASSSSSSQYYISSSRHPGRTLRAFRACCDTSVGPLSSRECLKLPAELCNNLDDALIAAGAELAAAESAQFRYSIEAVEQELELAVKEAQQAASAKVDATQAVAADLVHDEVFVEFLQDTFHEVSKLADNLKKDVLRAISSHQLIEPMLLTTGGKARYRQEVAELAKVKKHLENVLQRVRQHVLEAQVDVNAHYLSRTAAAIKAAEAASSSAYELFDLKNLQAAFFNQKQALDIELLENALKQAQEAQVVAKLYHEEWQARQLAFPKDVQIEQQVKLHEAAYAEQSAALADLRRTIEQKKQAIKRTMSSRRADEVKMKPRIEIQQSKMSPAPKNDLARRPKKPETMKAEDAKRDESTQKKKVERKASSLPKKQLATPPAPIAPVSCQETRASLAGAGPAAVVATQAAVAARSSPPPPPPPPASMPAAPAVAASHVSTTSRSSLLTEITNGFALRKVETKQQPEPKPQPAASVGAGGLLNAIVDNPKFKSLKKQTENADADHEQDF